MANHSPFLILSIIWLFIGVTACSHESSGTTDTFISIVDPVGTSDVAYIYSIENSGRGYQIEIIKPFGQKRAFGIESYDKLLKVDGITYHLSSRDSYATNIEVLKRVISNTEFREVIKSIPGHGDYAYITKVMQIIIDQNWLKELRVKMKKDRICEFLSNYKLPKFDMPPVGVSPIKLTMQNCRKNISVWRSDLPDNFLQIVETLENLSWSTEPTIAPKTPKEADDKEPLSGHKKYHVRPDGSIVTD